MAALGAVGYRLRRRIRARLAEDHRLSAATAHQCRMVVAGTDPVAIDSWCCRQLMMPLAGAYAARRYDLDHEQAAVTKFLRYYRALYVGGTSDLTLVQVV